VGDDIMSEGMVRDHLGDRRCHCVCISNFGPGDVYVCISGAVKDWIARVMQYGKRGRSEEFNTTSRAGRATPGSNLHVLQCTYMQHEGIRIHASATHE